MKIVIDPTCTWDSTNRIILDVTPVQVLLFNTINYMSLMEIDETN